jgi:Transposase DDE domain
MMFYQIIFATMFLKPVLKYLKTTGEHKFYYRLCESYRHENTVRHHTIVQLGTLEELPQELQRKNLVQRISSLVNQSRTGIRDMFEADDEHVESLAQKHFHTILKRERIDIIKGRDYETIDTHSIKNKDIREVGTEWMCAQAAQQLQIAAFLAGQEWDEKTIQLALTHIISRASYPASELRTAQWIKENSAVCEITNYAENKITKDKLYDISHKLFNVKDDLEKHLSKRTNELFDLHDTIYIYDLTNTYFEGQQKGSAIAQFGRSKEKRSDCKLIVLALVVNTEGFIKYSQLFEGNLTDSKSLLRIIKELSQRTSATQRKPTVVMDAGIATDDNVLLLRKYHFNYMVVARSSIKKYTADINSSPIIIKDKKEQPITLQKVKVLGDTDNYLLVHSQAKQAKEESMKSKFTARYEQALWQIKNALTKKRGTKKREKVWERIGRVKQKYPSVNKYYQIDIIADNKGNVTDLQWKQKTIPQREGKYLLRTNLDEKDEHTQWTIYNTIREIESTFRTLKTDLDLRPIYHKTDKAAMAHLHLGLLAYTVVNAIRHQLKQKGINNEWNDITRIMNTQKMVTTTMVNKYGQTIKIRQCSEPTPQVETIYNALKYKHKPFERKKVVVPPDNPDQLKPPD